ncbi:hypothetical protein [Mesorhizobium sp. M6A.T.Ce.TU.016.01.1.1]|uniref:hypothetical protein n=1 Tax=Mesorhizobium sp. M6A.T.Ce.TU.016.01.1.1 TaxID=2496783 RepID=UPI000FCA9855|nr:hypothetical protein [Mesorhizobium sp. M6A.T.Ce.TU.016.01.1.1]RUU29724.1 hypothetical protein EOC94_12700 [Mesorhizobium sp. M6A.T.Ce.TU.016.01.1.1]
MSGVRDNSGVEKTSSTLFTDARIKADHELLAVRAAVHPDGNEAKLTLHTSHGSVTVTVQHEQLAAIHAEIQAAAALMLYRQAMQADEGMTAFEDAFRAALMPADCSVSIDRQTSDRLFMLQFIDRLPLAIRMTPEQVAEALEQLGIVSRLSAN